MFNNNWERFKKELKPLNARQLNFLGFEPFYIIDKYVNQQKEEYYVTFHEDKRKGKAYINKKARIHLSNLIIDLPILLVGIGCLLYMVLTG